MERTLKVYFKALGCFFIAIGGFKNAKVELKKLLYYAFSETNISRREEIPALRIVQKKFIELLEISFIVYEAGALSTLIPEENVFSRIGHPRPELYFDPAAETLNLWDYYPHFLSKQEFANPYNFFEKFFAYKELSGWKNVLEELFHASLLHQSVIDFSDDIKNAIVLQDYLFKFLEVSHIIKVRHSDN